MRFFRRPPNVRHVKLICSEPRQSQPWQKTLLQRLLTVQAQILFTKINWRLDSSWQSTNLEKIEFCFVMITMWPACLQHSLQIYNINWRNKSFFYKKNQSSFKNAFQLKIKDLLQMGLPKYEKQKL